GEEWSKHPEKQRQCDSDHAKERNLAQTVQVVADGLRRRVPYMAEDQAKVGRLVAERDGERLLPLPSGTIIGRDGRTVARQQRRSPFAEAAPLRASASPLPPGSTRSRRRPACPRTSRRPCRIP